LANNTKSINWKRIGRISTTSVAVFIGLVILLILFFKFMPGFGFYIVKSGSMSPAINTGDLIFTRPQDDILGYAKAGDVITFKSGDIIVTHRAISIDDGFIKTKGDANEDPDGALVSPENVKGVVLFSVPAVGLITQVLHSRSGWFFVVIVPTIILVLLIVWEIIKEAFKKDEKYVKHIDGGEKH
jgi:signal peptidase